MGCQVGSRKFTFALEIVRFFETLLGVFRCHKILEFLKSKSIRNLLRFIFSTLCMRINLSDPKVRMVFGIAKCLLEYRVFFFDFKMKPLPSVFFFPQKGSRMSRSEESLCSFNCANQFQNQFVGAISYPYIIDSLLQ